MSAAIAVWKRRVQAYQEQNRRAAGAAAQSPDDIWSELASHFEADPRRADDPLLNRLLQAIETGATVLDVGAGAGTYALPLALHGAQVTAVEPSHRMVRALRDGAERAGVRDLAVLQRTWEEADLEPADLVLGAHVVYGVVEIEPFIRKLAAHARRRVLLLAHLAHPLERLAPLWAAVHGEERSDLPALPELMAVLWELGIAPNLEMFVERSPQTVPSRDAALKLLRALLYVRPDTDAERYLQRALDEALVETPGGLAIRGDGLRHQGLVGWDTRP